MVPEPRVAVARVGRPHGVCGELRLDAALGLPLGLSRYKRVWLNRQGEFSPVQMTGERRSGRYWVVKFSGVDTPEMARGYTHATLWVDRAEMPPLEDDEYYHVDLLGCRVEDDQGASLGEVVDVLPTGAHDLLVIRESGREWMIPLLSRWVPIIEVEHKRLVVRLPEGLRE